MEVESCTLHDAGDYTFVPEGYTQSLSAKIHIIGIYFIGKFLRHKNIESLFNLFTESEVY